MLIWTNLMIFAITYVIEVGCFKIFILQLRLRLIFCKHERAWNSFQAAVFAEYFDKIISFGI